MIDDADLAPDLLHRVLLDLRILCESDRVQAVVCLDPEEALRGLAEHYLAAFPSLVQSQLEELDPLRRVHGIVQSQFSKSIPPRYATRVRDLRLTERLEFRPLEVGYEEDTLIQILRQIAIPGAPSVAPATLADYFQYNLRSGGEAQPTEFAYCLSGNPRDLSTLYYKLTSLIDKNEWEVTQAAVEELAEHGLQHGLGNGQSRKSPDELIVFDAIDRNEVVNVDLSSIRTRWVDFGNPVEFLLPVHRPDNRISQADIQIRHVSHLSSFLKFPDNTGTSLEQLDNAVLQTVLFVNDLAYSHKVLTVQNPGSDLVSGGIRGSHCFRMYVDGERADDRFFHHPAWDSFFDYYQVRRAWDAFVDTLDSTSASNRNELILALASLEWFRIHTEVQSSRYSAPMENPYIADFFSSEEDRREHVLREACDQVWNRIGAVYKEQLKHGSSRALDYVHWVEEYTLSACIDGLHPNWFVESCIEHRDRIVKSADRARTANYMLVMRLTSRISNLIKETWIDIPLIMLDRFDQNAAEEFRQLNEHELQALDRRRIVRLGAATAAAAGRVSKDDQSTSILREIEAMEKEARER
ncbi:hypothetical protein [Gordonia sp. N1V]|uniref:hypothetical protein n=1 Tax=Gordonia sp. N1V TaxID=3034163 RepID=UPI0023E2EDC7|nr:hypothetical protein [Gordonia sp. N1V]MDF3284965.1 hypothetical protein [Gordonia sp. N1V]